jgi:tetratricopeptide (TPR) repeat protein
MTTQEVAYNMMLFSQRRALHRAVAEWYEQTHAEDLSPYYSLLAYHWRMANVIPTAIDFLEKAGEQALLNYANEEAVEFLSEALALADELEGNQAELSTLAEAETTPPPQLRQALWETKLGEAYVNWAKLSEGRAHLERGLKLLGYPLPGSTFKLVTGLGGQILKQVLYRLWPASSNGGQAARREILLEAARAYEGLTAVYYFANETVLTLYAAFRSLNLAEAAGPSPELARGYASVGVIISFVPLHRFAEAYCRRALAMAQQIDNLPARSWVSLLSGVYYAGVGRWNTAENLLGQVIDLAEKLGDRSRWDDGVGNLAMVTFFRGQFNRSTKLYDDLLAAAQRHRDAHNQAWALRGQVNCLLLRGEFTEAQSRLETLQNLLAEHSHIVDEALNIDLYGLLAVVYLRQGKTESALAAAEQALDLMAQTSPTSYLSLSGYAGVAETFLKLWESEKLDKLGFMRYSRWPLAKNYVSQNRRLRLKLRAQGRQACKALRSYARVFPIGKPPAYLWQGLFEWLSGRPSRAHHLWRKSLTTARQLDMPYAQGLAHLEIGCHLPPDDPNRVEHLVKARVIFAQLEAAYDIQQTQEALA